MQWLNRAMLRVPTENTLDREEKIMAEWVGRKISDIGTVVGGATPSTKKPENYEDGKIAWITPKDLSTFSSRYIERGERNITEIGLKSCSTQLLPPNTILFSSRAPIGYVAIAANEVCTNQGFKSVIPNENTDPLFLFYLLKYNRDKIEGMGSGTTFKEVSGNTMKNIVVNVPTDKKVQEKIAAILGSIDDKIEENDQINNNLLQQLHVLYLRLFCESAMDTPLGDVVATTSGGTPSRKHDEYYSDSSICWVKSKELLGNYIHETEEHINDLAIKKSSAKLLPEHSVLIAMYGATVGAYGVISKPMTCNQAVCALLCNENYPYTYLFQIAYESQQKFINLAVGSAQQNISQVLIKQLNLHSDLDIIQRFHDLALPMHQEIEFLQAENIRLSDLRDNLLPKLMSGELDVSNIDL